MRKALMRIKIEQLMTEGGGLASVLLAISEVAQMKAQYIRESHQDRALADAWDDAADELIILAAEIAI